MLSVPLRAVQALADEYDKKLRADDPRLNRIVVVRDTGEMTTMVFDHAFVMFGGEDGEYYLVFTEHHGTHVFHHEDADVSQYSKVGIERLET